MANHRTVLWWGRFDPDYSRNRILRQVLENMGWQIQDFYPSFSALGDFEAFLRHQPKADLVWVPCFRQRDLAAARRWSNKHHIPLLADPLISAWDKQVFERAKFAINSPRAQRLQQWESALMQASDIVLVDTPAHAEFFADKLGVQHEKLHVVYVGAEQPLFSCEPSIDKSEAAPLEVLFFGSFIGLQGVQVIVEAARQCAVSEVRWTLLGDGPERRVCEDMARGLARLRFEEWLPYEKLPQRICQADLVLGIFGTSEKAGRVIPNKVFQALACGRPLVTREAVAYPPQLLKQECGIRWVAPGDAASLADTIAELASDRRTLASMAAHARQTYEDWFSSSQIKQQLIGALSAVGF